MAMIGNEDGIAGKYRLFPWDGLATGLVVVGLLVGCSSVPDAVNPVEWYKGARDAVSGDATSEEKNQAVRDAKSLPDNGESFPNLSSVPEKPSGLTAAEREKLAGELVADRQHARYTDEVIRRRAPASTVKTPSATPSVTRQSIAPAPAPPVVAKAPDVPWLSKTTSLEPPRQLAATPQPKAVVTPLPKKKIATPSAESTGSGKALTNMTFGPPPTDIAIAQNSTPTPPQPVQSNNSLSNLTFGPPPTDIAIAQKTVPLLRRNNPPGSIATDTSRKLRAPGYRRDAVAQEGQATIVLFATGSSQLNSTAHRQLRKIARMQREWRGAIRIVGHSSSWTADMDLERHHMVNFEVSLDRAQSVARELMHLGVNPQDLLIDAVSDRQPDFFEVMPAGEAANRYVEIFFERRG